MVPDGETDLEPEATGVAAPTLWLMDAEAVFVVVHESVEEPPASIEVGEALSVQVGGGGGGIIVIVAAQVTTPPGPLAVRV